MSANYLEALENLLIGFLLEEILAYQREIVVDSFHFSFTQLKPVSTWDEP